MKNANKMYTDWLKQLIYICSDAYLFDIPHYSIYSPITNHCIISSKFVRSV